MGSHLAQLHFPGIHIQMKVPTRLTAYASQVSPPVASCRGDTHLEEARHICAARSLESVRCWSSAARLPTPSVVRDQTAKVNINQPHSTTFSPSSNFPLVFDAVDSLHLVCNAILTSSYCRVVLISQRTRLHLLLMKHL